LLEVLRMGAPPHGGFALGLDRFLALLAGEPNIREVVAFPKAARGSEPMTGAPTPVLDEQLRELGIRAIVPTGYGDWQMWGRLGADGAGVGGRRPSSSREGRAGRPTARPSRRRACGSSSPTRGRRAGPPSRPKATDGARGRVPARARARRRRAPGRRGRLRR